MHPHREITTRLQKGIEMGKVKNGISYVTQASWSLILFSRLCEHSFVPTAQLQKAYQFFDMQTSLVFGTIEADMC